MFGSSEQSVTLGPEEFRLLRDFVNGFCGLWFDDDSAYFLERRLQHRLRERQLVSFLDYYYLLLYGPEREEELAKVVDVLTTNETYFFREMNQLRTLPRRTPTPWYVLSPAASSPPPPPRRVGFRAGYRGNGRRVWLQ